MSGSATTGAHELEISSRRNDGTASTSAPDRKEHECSEFASTSAAAPAKGKGQFMGDMDTGKGGDRGKGWDGNGKGRRRMRYYILCALLASASME
jgi:hypothetical protein